MARKNVVIVRAGDTSLHTQWVTTADRSWDIVVSFYGVPSECRIQACDFIHFCRGSKWEGVSDFVNGNADFLAAYDYIWIPDDDILTSAENINTFFDLCSSLSFTIAQPALTPDSSHSWPITVQRSDLIARKTDFVEIMAPCFRGSTLEIFSGTFSENSSGWGYEWLWYDIARRHGVDNFGIIDRTPVSHTRPVGTADHGGARNDPHDEMRQLLSRFGLAPSEPRVFDEIRA